MIQNLEHPKHHYRYCPRCGQKGSLNDQEMSFKCVACGFYFFLNAAAAVTALIFNDKDELLFVRRGVEPALGKLDLPGGFIDPGENAEEAILREVKEELGLVPDRCTYYGSFANRYRFSGTVVTTVDFVFLCLVSDLTLIKCDDDVAAFEFINPESIDLEEIPFSSVKQLLKRIQHEPKR